MVLSFGCYRSPPKKAIKGDSNFWRQIWRVAGRNQAPPNFWEVPGLPRKSPELPRKFFGDLPGSSLTVELNSNPGVPRKFPRLPRKFSRLPRKFPDFPGGQPLSLGSLTPSPDSQILSLNWFFFFLLGRTYFQTILPFIG